MHRQALLLKQVDDEGVTFAWLLASLQQQQHLIHLPDRCSGALHQALPKEVMGFVDPGGIHKDQLGRFRGEDGSAGDCGWSWATGEVIATLSPTSWLTRVDFPTPPCLINATKPERNVLS